MLAGVAKTLPVASNRLEISIYMKGTEKDTFMDNDRHFIVNTWTSGRSL